MGENYSGADNPAGIGLTGDDCDTIGKASTYVHKGEFQVTIESDTQAIENVQKYFQEQGVYQGTIDGMWGSGSGMGLALLEQQMGEKFWENEKIKLPPELRASFEHLEGRGITSWSKPELPEVCVDEGGGLQVGNIELPELQEKPGGLLQKIPADLPELGDPDIADFDPGFVEKIPAVLPKLGDPDIQIDTPGMDCDTGTGGTKTIIGPAIFDPDAPPPEISIGPAIIDPDAPPPEITLLPGELCGQGLMADIHYQGETSMLQSFAEATGLDTFFSAFFENDAAAPAATAEANNTFTLQT